jgi:hypothetical protein
MLHVNHIQGVIFSKITYHINLLGAMFIIILVSSGFWLNITTPLTTGMNSGKFQLSSLDGTVLLLDQSHAMIVG